MADEKLNTGPAENISPEAAEPIATSEQAAAFEPQQECSYTVKKQQHKLRTAYPTILYQSGAVTRKCCCSIFMPLK